MSAPSAGERSAFNPLLLDNEDDRILDSIFDKYDIKRDNSFPGRQPRSACRNKSKFEDSRPSSSGRFAEHLRSFSPGARKSGEDILNRLKNQLRKESDMFFQSTPDWDYNMQPRKADDSDDWAHKGFDDMRSRHPMFRMPNWMSQEDDVANLASRMSQSPHFTMMGRRGAPRRNSGGSAMSGTSEEDSVDGHHTDRSSQSSGPSTAVRIPIRIEAEAPPGYVPAQPQPQPQPQQEPEPQQQQQQQNLNLVVNEPPHPMGHIKKQPQFASKTTSAMDTVNPDEVPRNTRCSSAPPDMAEPLHGHRFVSKTNIVPPNPTENPFSSSPVFNNVAKPYVSTHKAQEATPPIAEEPGPGPHMKQDMQQQQYPGQQQQQQQQQQQHFQEQPQQYPQPPQYQYSQQQQQQYPPQQYSQQQQQYPPQQQQQQQYPQQQQQYPQQPQPQPQWEGSGSGHKSSVVRNIPIIFEGRNKPSPSSKGTSTPPCASPPKAHHQAPPPNRSQWDHPFDNPFQTPPYGFVPHQKYQDEDPFFHFNSGYYPSAFQHPQSRFQPSQSHQYEQPQPNQYQPPPPQQPKAQQFHQPQPSQPPPQPQHHQPPPPPPPPAQPKEPSPPKDPKMDKIASVRKAVTELQDKVNNFQGNEKNKDFIFIDEMLTRALLQLDDIDPDGRDDVRQARRTLVKDINETISKLEKKVAEKPAPPAPEAVSDAPTQSASEETGPSPQSIPEGNKPESGPQGEANKDKTQENKVEDKNEPQAEAVAQMEPPHADTSQSSQMDEPNLEKPETESKADQECTAENKKDTVT